MIVERYYVIFVSVTVEKKSGTEQRERARGSRERAEKKFKIWSEKKNKKKQDVFNSWRVDVHLLEMNKFQGKLVSNRTINRIT